MIFIWFAELFLVHRGARGERIGRAPKAKKWDNITSLWYKFQSLKSFLFHGNSTFGSRGMAVQSVTNVVKTCENMPSFVHALLQVKQKQN